MTRLCLIALAMFVVLAPAASAAGTYRDRDDGVEVRVVRGKAVVRFVDQTCGAGAVTAKVRARRIARSTVVRCEPSAEPFAKTVRVVAKVRRLRVAGTVGGRRFVARRGASRPSAAQRCGHRGYTIAETEAVRVFEESDPRSDSQEPRITAACRLRDGAFAQLARVEPDAGDGERYEEGTRAVSVQAVGSRVAFRHSSFDTAAEYYGAAGSGAPFDHAVVVRDLEAGTETTINPELGYVGAVALHPDGRVAWAGTETRDARGGAGPGDIFVKTRRDGTVVTLDQGTILMSSLRATSDGFAWDRDGAPAPA